MSSKLKIIIIVSIVAVAAFFAYDDYQKYYDKNFRVIFLNIGQGDSALIRFRSGEKMLVDCGPDKTVLARLGTHLSFFDRTIDYLVVTHPDLDHYGGCADVARRYKIKNIIENGDQSKTDSYFEEWGKVAGAEGANRQVIKDFSDWTIASTTINWLYPNSNVKVEKDDSNNRSIVFKLTDAGGESFLFTGDAEWPLEDALIKFYCSASSTCLALQSDYLKVGHHGSDSSSGAQWLAVVSPKTALISVGENKYGHPSLRVLRNLQRVGAGILRTDKIGDIITTSKSI